MARYYNSKKISVPMVIAETINCPKFLYAGYSKCRPLKALQKQFFVIFYILFLDESFFIPFFFYFHFFFFLLHHHQCYYIVFVVVHWNLCLLQIAISLKRCSMIPIVRFKCIVFPFEFAQILICIWNYHFHWNWNRIETKNPRLIWLNFLCFVT